MGTETKKLAAGLGAAVAIFVGVWSVGAPVVLASTSVAKPPTAEATPPPPQSEIANPLGSCGQSFNPELYYGPNHWDVIGRAHWDLTCSSGKITIAGWVQDVDDDGKCVRVKATFNGGIVKKSGEACYDGEKKTFSWTYSGTIADAVLFSYKSPNARD